MHAIILAGGKGLRLRELTYACPKGLLPIGDSSLVDHIICHLAEHHVDSVTIAAGYRCNDYQVHFEQATNTPLPVKVVDTGLEVETGGRLKRLKKSVFDQRSNGEPILLCWSDGLSDLDISAMLAQHIASNNLVTLAAVPPPARFGDLQLDGNSVTNFAEKQPHADRWINGGYFIIDASILTYISGDSSSWEYEVLSTLSDQGRLGAYRHHGNWACMDTVHEHSELNELAKTDQAFWPMVNHKDKG